ncbi:MAG: mandelate racemase/muconate lactonizing enzyme family protein [Chloroflexota bacterium]|nr:mandelate racemase/muconate lactonizing enzyme family protein [Chloroflexota bacterium]
MKITDFKITYWEGEAERAIGDANGPYGSKRLPGSFLEIFTDEGITGYSLIGNGYVEKLFPLLEGKDPRSVIGLWKEMNDLVFKGGNEGERCDAISAIDLALWDLKAKIADQPLWKLLGSSTNSVKAYASGIDLNLTDDEIYKFYSRMADMGIDAGKLKVGLDLDSDERRLGIVKDALSKASDRPLLCIDSNEYWSPKQAIRFISKLEEKFDITWAEEPARRWDYNGLKKVSDNIKAAVATGENINDLAEFMPLIDNGAVDIVEVGMGTTGLTGAMKVANMAYAYELPVAMMNCPGNTMAHLATNLPNHMMMEVVDNGRELFFNTDHHIADGKIILGDKPGFGIDVDFDKLNELKVSKHSTPKHESYPFPRREGAGLIIKPLEKD